MASQKGVRLELATELSNIVHVVLQTSKIQLLGDYESLN